MAASAGNAVGTVGGFMKMSEGRKMQKKAQSKIDAFEWQDLENPYENLEVSTLGSDLKKEQINTANATAVEALRGGGTRGIVGGIGKVQANTNTANREIAANLDEQQKTIDYAKAGDQVQQRNMIEKRQGDELAGYGQMLNVGMGMKYGGMADVQASGQAQSQHNMEVMETFGGGMGGGMSDRRLKKNIELVGTSPKGLSIYNFEYTNPKYGVGVFQGVMSDEIPQEAVSKTEEGYDIVDYSLLDVEFLKIRKIK